MKLKEALPQVFFQDFMNKICKRCRGSGRTLTRPYPRSGYSGPPFMINCKSCKGTGWVDTRVAKLLEVEVVMKVDGTLVAFPGTHKNVYVWWKLVDGHAVGMNENPSIGLSFPVVKIRK